jgi:glycine dehydrogenase
MIQIRKEVDEIVEGKQPKDNNVLKNAPHPAHVLALPDAEWNRYAFQWPIGSTLQLNRIVRPYSRFTAVYPVSSLLERKFWPTISRIDDGMFHPLMNWRTAEWTSSAYGDLNLVCDCPSVEEVESLP